MEKLDSKTDGASADIVGQNIDKLKQFFPDVFTEGNIDFDVLREMLGDYIDDRQERYSFNWNGKSRARRIAQTPSTGTLRPCPEESINWGTTQNLFIEGDNLEALKLLQKSYHKRVKMVYIDPPYNTGNQFIYPDKFQDNLRTYLRYTGQVDEEGLKLSANSEASGRYHTNWLNMMLPRLKLARNLLREDGAIFLSIDDHEVAKLRLLCDEVFGEENFVVCIVWEKIQTRKNSARYFSESHDYILCYARSKEAWKRNLIPRGEDTNYSNPDNDANGPWKLDRIYANNPYSADYTITRPDGKKLKRPEGKFWRYSKESIKRFIEEGRLVWSKKGTYPHVKRYLSEVQDGLVPTSLFDRKFAGDNGAASRELSDLLGSDKIMSYPKPSQLMLRLQQTATTNQTQDIVLDFFSGSCSTAHSVLRLNREDSGNRRFIMVQLPEPCEKNSDAYESGYKNISEIGKARIRRVIEKMDVDASDLDLGFKVFKLDSSNIKPWDADFDNLENSLFNAVENIKPDRSETDILYELLLKYGLDLAVPIKESEIAKNTVYVIGAGALVVCLSKQISLEVVEGIAALKDELKPEVMRVVFKDSGFVDDVVKTNAVQILRQAGIDDIKSL